MACRRSIFVLAVVGTLFGRPVRAQDLHVPRVEIGGNLSGVLTAFSGGEGPFMLLGGGPRLTANLSPRVSLEFLGDIVVPEVNSGHTGFYLAQVKLPFMTTGGGGTLSFTIGASGIFSYQHFGEVRKPRPDGSTVVHPGYDRFRATPLNNIALGLTREEAISRHVGGSLAVQALLGPSTGFSVRLAAGISFGPGGYR
jgi:hypothetical protein